jgi:transposase
MLLKIGEGRSQPETRSFKNTAAGRAKMIGGLKKRAAAAGGGELVRTRIDVAEKITAVKTQIQSLLKRNHIVRDKGTGKGWTRLFRVWLKFTLAESDSSLGPNGRSTLASLVRQLDFLEGEERKLTAQVHDLAAEPRYEAMVEEVTSLCGVGLLTAMVFLTELGDLSRFTNRRQIAAYLGLAPRSFESGEANDRKGHITHQGSSRVRKVLCQATWARVRHNQEEQEAYARIVERNPKKKKIAVVASMRRLAVRMWHRGRAFQGKPSRSMILAAEAAG